MMNNKIKETPISFETALLAKEKGFNYVDCSGFYQLYDQGHEFCATTGVYKQYPTSLLAPTQSLLQTWLREEKGIKVYCIVSALSSRPNDWIYVISRIGYEHIHQTNSIFNSYEKALGDGLLAALQLDNNTL